MKKLLLISPFFFLLLMSCEVVIVEEPVPVIHDARDHFVGFYSVEEYNVTRNIYAEYTFDIVKSSRYVDGVFIRNFYGTGIEVYAEVIGRDIFIPDQEVDGFHIEGSGYINGRELILDYTVHDHLSHNARVQYFETVAWL